MSYLLGHWSYDPCLAAGPAAPEQDWPDAADGFYWPASDPRCRAEWP